MVLERHRVGDELKTLIQTAVRLDVQVLGILIRNVEQLLRVAVYRAAIVDFELYAKMTQTFTMKHKVRRVVYSWITSQCSSQQDMQ